MTTDKARKRAVRSRMQKTGERYAAARRHVVRADEPTELPPRIAEPGMTEASIIKGTGHGWDHWLRTIDAWGGIDHNHTDIARYVSEELGVADWWSQAVTVGYERARGMRARHERPEGFEVSVSKTVAMSAIDAWRAFVEPSRRAAWLDVPVRMRTGTRTMGRSARFDLPSEDTRINVTFTEKDGGRSTVTVTHVKLPDAAAVEARRADWKRRLAALATLSAGRAVGSGSAPAAEATPNPVARTGRRAS